jgi:hypothetical protein
MGWRVKKSLLSCFKISKETASLLPFTITTRLDAADFHPEGVTARNGQQSTLRLFVNDLTKRKRARIRLQPFYEKTAAGDRLLCGGGSVFLMTCFRTPFHEEREVLSVLRFPFRVRTPDRSPCCRAVKRGAVQDKPCSPSKREADQQASTALTAVERLWRTEPG